MWESRTKDPLGRLSTRKWLRAATTIFVACFAYLLITVSPVSAVDPPTQDTPSSQNTTTDPSTNPDSTTTETQPTAATTATSDDNSCKVDGVGWFVCSMSRWIADGVDYIYGVLTNFFIFTPLATSGENNSMYQIWSAVRNMANIAFIIAFLVIIYGQITGGAVLSNYTIKRLLPRVIIAAILVNTSFWICALAIDISNVLGVAVQDLFTSFRDSIGPAAKDFPKWADVTSGILGGTGIAIGGGALLLATGGTVGGLAFLLLGALLPAIFAALVAVAVLAARQALITLFVIIAPLAFVAYLLPNTEEWFTRWRKLFMTMLVMFPAFSFIFGASQVAGIIVIQNAKDITVALLGLTIQVVPLFITPFLIKLSSGLLGTIAGMANNRSKGVFDRTANWAKGNRELHRQRGFARRPATTQLGRIARPTNLAQRLNNRRLRREGMTAAHQAVSEARFAGTRGGQAIYERQKRADLYKNTANSQAEFSFRERVVSSPHLQSYVDRTTQFTNRAKQAEELVQDRANATWEQTTLTDRTVYSRNLERQSLSRQIKSAQDEWESIIKEASTGGSADYNSKFGPITSDVSSAISRLTTAETKIAAEAFRKVQADVVLQNQLTESLLKDSVQISGVNIREYAGGIRGKEGADSVLASAVAKDRKEFGERIAEKAQLIKHFNLSSGLRQTLAMGTDVTTTKDGVTYTFEATDPYARDAVVDEQLATGSFSQIKEIIDAAVPGGSTYDYRTTISQAVAQRGLDNKAFFWGAKSIDDLSQGLYSEPQAIKEHLLGDKVKAEKLAVQDVYSLRKAFEAPSDPAVTSLLTTPAERIKFQENYEAMRQSADLILRTPELSKSLNHEAREILERYRA